MSYVRHEGVTSLGRPFTYWRPSMPRIVRRRRVIKRLDERYVVPADLDLIQVLLVWQEQNNDGGAGFHHVYVTLCEEVDDAPADSAVLDALGDGGDNRTEEQ